MSDVSEALQRLIAAARPFISADVVDETTGTIPLMEELASAIEQAESVLAGDDNNES
jgi:hypothetical protein